MEHQTQVAAYKNNSHMVRKTRQVVMLYEGAIRYVKQARKAIEGKDIQTRYNSLTKACDIITGLQLSLNFDKGGDVAQLLYDYYASLDMRLLSIHQSEDLELLDSCERHLKMMREAWDEIDRNHEMNVNTEDATKVTMNGYDTDTSEVSDDASHDDGIDDMIDISSSSDNEAQALTDDIMKNFDDNYDDDDAALYDPKLSETLSEISGTPKNLSLTA